MILDATSSIVLSSGAGALLRAMRFLIVRPARQNFSTLHTSVIFQFLLSSVSSVVYGTTFSSQHMRLSCASLVSVGLEGHFTTRQLH